MYAILLIFVVSFNLVSSDVANVQQLLERVDLLELKLASLSNAYEMLLEDRHQQSQCNCSDLKEDIQELATLIQTNEVDIEAKVQSNTADLAVRKVQSNVCFLGKHKTYLSSFQILNTKVIFNAKKTKGYSDVTGDLTFDQVDINIGNGFDGSSGIFKAPVSGIYKISFSGQSSFGRFDNTYIWVVKNGDEILKIWDSNDAEKADVNNVSYTWIMRLVKGDKLKLNSMNYLYAGFYSPLTFTGELIHIEN